MIVEINNSLHDYLKSTEKNTKEVLKNNANIMNIIYDFDEYFSKILWRDVQSLSPISMCLSLNAYMLHMAAIKTSSTGHVSAVFPVLRTALESACYAYLISKKPDLEDVWISRHKDRQSLKLCRNKFSSAVIETVKLLESEQPSSGQWIADAYDASIDLGGHPNIRSVFGHISISETHPSDSHERISLIGLYGPEHWEIRRILIACLDFALAIAIVLTRSLKSPDHEHQSKLQILSDKKNELVDELNGKK